MPHTNSSPSLGASGFLASRLLTFLSNTPSAQEKLGSRRLDEARDLAQKYQAAITSSDLKIIKDKFIHAAEIRAGIESKSGISRFLQGREYKKAAKDALRFVKVVSDHVKDEILGQRPLGLDPLLTSTEGAVDVRLCDGMKPQVSTLVEHLYHFNTSKAPENIRSNVKLAEMLLRDMNFIYQEAWDGGKRHSPYRHPIIQEAINVTLFRNKDDLGVVHHEHFSPMPIPIIGLILTVIQCCIDEWSDGQRKDSSWGEEKIQAVYTSHVSSLLAFQALGLERNVDVLNQLQRDLLKSAREHAGVPPHPMTEPGDFRENYGRASSSLHPPLPPSYDLPDIVVYEDS